LAKERDEDSCLIIDRQMMCVWVFPTGDARSEMIYCYFAHIGRRFFPEGRVLAILDIFFVPHTGHADVGLLLRLLLGNMAGSDFRALYSVFRIYRICDVPIENVKSKPEYITRKIIPTF
jgi:hypothetical protein